MDIVLRHQRRVTQAIDVRAHTDCKSPLASGPGGIHDFLYVRGLRNGEKGSQGKICVKEDSIIGTKDDFTCVVPLLEPGSQSWEFLGLVITSIANSLCT